MAANMTNYAIQSSRFKQLLLDCNGIDKTTIQEKNWKGQPEDKTYLYLTGEEFIVPPDQFIRIKSTATKGTVAKIVDMELDVQDERWAKVEGQISEYSATLIYESIDNKGKKKKGRIQKSYVDFMDPLDPEYGNLKYVRNVKSHADKKKEVKNPVNKYQQELQRGDWVVGVLPRKRLGIGRITRWTNHNVWAVPGDNLDDKSREFKFDTIQETFTMPNSDHTALLTMAVLKGWDGK